MGTDPCHQPHGWEWYHPTPGCGKWGQWPPAPTLVTLARYVPKLCSQGGPKMETPTQTPFSRRDRCLRWKNESKSKIHSLLSRREFFRSPKKDRCQVSRNHNAYKSIPTINFTFVPTLEGNQGACKACGAVLKEEKPSAIHGELHADQSAWEWFRLKI